MESSQPKEDSVESSTQAESDGKDATRRGSQTWRERAGARLVGFGEYGNLSYSDAYWSIQYMRPMPNYVGVLKKRKAELCRDPESRKGRRSTQAKREEGDFPRNMAYVEAEKRRR